MFVAFWNRDRLISLHPRTLVCVQIQSMLRKADSHVGGVLEQPQINYSISEYSALCTETSTEIVFTTYVTSEFVIKQNFVK